MIPILSPFCTPIDSNPLETASICLSNSSKSHARWETLPKFLEEGPPCALGFSDEHIKAGLVLCLWRISWVKYSERVLVSSGGCEAPCTTDNVEAFRHPQWNRWFDMRSLAQGTSDMFAKNKIRSKVEAGPRSYN
ncbi:hypothetical protein HHX47_DHR4001067, partial [Lentinula edodes]